jgi:iron-sulfur cluster repair protein YtfE (RIC family)
MEKKRSDLAKQIQQDHEEMKQEMGLLKKEIEKEVSPDQFSQWRMEFLWKLRDFKNDMLKHFDLEELSDFPTELRNLAPHYMSRFEDIKAEHKKIVIDLEEILQLLKDMNDLSSFNKVRQKLNELLSFIHSHEAAERELLEDTYLQDYGAKD